MAWSVHVINRPTLVMTGGVITAGDLGTLETAVVEFYDFRRNGIGEGQVTFHVTDPVASTHFVIGPGSSHVLTRELWVYEDSTLRWVGVPQAGDVDLQRQTVTMRLREPSVLLRDKVFGRADRENKVDNGGFEDATIAPWTEVDPLGVATVTLDTLYAIEGAKSLKIVATANNAARVDQTLADGVIHDYGPGLGLIVAARLKVDGAADCPVGTPLLQVEISATGLPSYSDTYFTDSTFELGVEQYISVGVQVSAGTTWTAVVRLYGVDGTVNWDSVQAVYPDATTMSIGDDIGVLIGNIVEYSQTSSLGQSDDDIGHDVTTLGIVPPGPRGFSHADHEGIWDGLMQLAEEHAIDIWLGLDREIHADTHRGTLRSDLEVDVQLVGDELVVTGPALAGGQSMSIDPSKAFSSVIVIGEGTGFARDEVGAVDTTEFGGLVKSKVIRAPVSATVRSMGELAESTLAEGKWPPVLPSVTYHLPDLDDAPEPGDTIPVLVDFGCVQANGTLRVEKVTIDPETSTATVSFDEDWAA